MKVAVIGCGTAGPAAAALLAGQENEVILFERAPECRPVGAGFLLQPSGMEVLSELGILDPVLAHAARMDRLHVVDAKGGSLLDLHYSMMGADRFGAGLHRPVLLHYLIGAAVSAGVSMRWGWGISKVSRVGNGWEITTIDGRCEDGFDLVIVADGARSGFRDLAGSGGVDRGYAWGAHWFIGKNDGSFRENELHQVVNGTRKLCGFLATGRDLGGGDPLVSLFWSIKVADDAAWRSRPLDEWKAQVLAMSPRAENLLSQIGSWDQILLARYGDVRMPRWHGKGVVVLGDAGHAMSPQLGQGVNLALADASWLAECLRRGPLDEALAAYTRGRWFQLRYYQLATRWLTPFFQSDHEWLVPARQGFFTAARHLPPARKLMTLSMAGLIGGRGGFRASARRVP